MLVAVPVCKRIEHLLRSLSIIYVTVVDSEDAGLVNTNRGITMSSAIRRKPNAFNLLHQLLFLQRTGMGSDAHLKAGMRLDLTIHIFC